MEPNTLGRSKATEVLCRYKLWWKGYLAKAKWLTSSPFTCLRILREIRWKTQVPLFEGQIRCIRAYYQLIILTSINWSHRCKSNQLRKYMVTRKLLSGHTAENGSVFQYVNKSKKTHTSSLLSWYFNVVVAENHHSQRVNQKSSNYKQFVNGPFSIAMLSKLSNNHRTQWP